MCDRKENGEVTTSQSVETYLPINIERLCSVYADVSQSIQQSMQRQLFLLNTMFSNESQTQRYSNSSSSVVHNIGTSFTISSNSNHRPTSLMTYSNEEGAHASSKSTNDSVQINRHDSLNLKSQASDGTSRSKQSPDRWSSKPEFVHGAAASFVNIVITFPLNKLMFRQQVEGLPVRAALRTMLAEGTSNLYRGIGPPLLQRSVSMSIMFGLYDYYYKVMSDYGVLQAHYPKAFIAAMLAGSTEAILCPLERIQTILQHRQYTTQVDNMWDAARTVRAYGLKEFYRGLSAVLMRNGPSNAAFFILRQPIRDLLPGNDESNQAWKMTRDFFSGAMLGALLSTAFFPINVAKSVMQSQLGGKNHGVFSTIAYVLKQRDGVSGLFRGVHLNLVRSLISWGIINTAYEVFHRHDTFGLLQKEKDLHGYISSEERT